MPTITGSLDIKYRGGGVTSSGTLYYAGVASPSPPLGVFIRGVSLGQEDLQGNIDPLKPSASLSGILVGIGSGEDSISGSFIRGLLPGEEDLGFSYKSFDHESQDLISNIRPFQNGTEDLVSVLHPVDPVDLFGSIVGNSFEGLSAEIFSVEPVDLPAQISGRPFSDLFASFQGYDQLDLSATITGNQLKDLFSTVTGISPGSENLFAEINAGEIDRIFCSITGLAPGDIDLLGTYNSVEPVDIASSYFAVPPSELGASLTAEQEPDALPAEISGVLRQDQLTGSIESAGGFSDLSSYIFPVFSTTESLLAEIDPAGASDLQAGINNDTQETISASVTPVGPLGNKNLSSSINSIHASDLSASISPFDSPTLPASYLAVEGHFLQAAIYPDVFYIDALIPINTYAFDELSVSINADKCETRSSHELLSAGYDVIYKGDMGATIIGAHNLVKTADLLKIGFSKQHLVKDFLRLSIEPPAISSDYLKIVLLNAPHSDLSASIFGVESSADLSATISPENVGSFFSSDPSQGLWVNPTTGQRRIIRFLFTMTGKTYFYNQVADRTFPEDRKDSVKLIVETYDPIDEEATLSPTMMGEKARVRRCVVSDLDPFDSWDEAVRFGIRCAAGMFDNLSASIFPTGGSQTLSSSIFPLSNLRQRFLKGKITPVGNLPDLGASINPSGGFTDTQVVLIRALHPGQTEELITATELNEFLAPIMLTFNDDNPQVILHKIVSTGNLILSPTPGLRAEIIGVDQEDLSAVISGSV